MTLEEIIIECHLDGLAWWPETARDLVFNSLAMLGELGEFANLVKKCERGSLDYADSEVKMDLVEELTDLFTYICATAAIMNVDLEKSYIRKRIKNCERWGVPDHAAAIARVNGQAGTEDNGVRN